MHRNLSLKKILQQLDSEHIKVYLTWVRAYIGIEGNEKADRAVELHSWTGDIGRQQSTTTHNGIRQASRAFRKDWRTEASYMFKSHYNYKALSAYTWMRANKGPRRQWLYK